MFNAVATLVGKRKRESKDDDDVAHKHVSFHAKTETIGGSSSDEDDESDEEGEHSDSGDDNQAGNSSDEHVDKFIMESDASDEQQDTTSDENDEDDDDDDEQDGDYNVDNDSSNEDDEEDRADSTCDEFGPLAFRDPDDRRFLLGFELRHFQLEPQYDKELNMDTIDLRRKEKSMEDRTLNDNIVQSLINSLLNSSDAADNQKGQEMLEKLKDYQSKAADLTAANTKNAGKVRKKYTKRKKDTPLEH
ncbi:hypothetical protein BC940DRAFT_86972 [Gongronella butleri]|nr:hypothetical protein BC940DRAFT_86972 [Gongronella butleri]